MLVLLVRHGHAGTKRQWPGDDEFRPLDAQGLVAAQALVPLLASLAPARILSSPFLRCAQSMAPLGHALGMEVESSPSLTPDAGRAARKLVLGVSAHGSGAVVVCTHGEVIHDLQSSLGKQAPPNFNTHAPREKASIWMLERSSGRFVSASYILPSVVASVIPGGEAEANVLHSAHQ
jgi:8-oxo-(d)GTP phosphatase